MKRISKSILAALVAGFVAMTCQHAQGAMITGAISFSGGAKFDTTSLATAMKITTFKNVKVEDEDGDFSAFVSDNDAVTMAANYIFNPSTSTDALWKVGGFTFDLASSTIKFQDAGALFITGKGTITGNGFDPTPGDWSFTTQAPSANGTFSFSASGEFPGNSAGRRSYRGFARTRTCRHRDHPSEVRLGLERELQLSGKAGRDYPVRSFFVGVLPLVFVGSSEILMVLRDPGTENAEGEQRKQQFKLLHDLILRFYKNKFSKNPND